MMVQWFRVILEEDVILSADACTEGNHFCLPYLPGSALLGACIASDLRNGTEFDPAVALSGQIRLSNAYPEWNSLPAVPTPRSFMCPKEGKIGAEEQAATLPYLLPEPNPSLRRLSQPFWSPATADLLTPVKNFRMKTAIDRNTRRAKNSSLFGYEALEKGQTFLFSIEAESTLSSVLDRWTRNLTRQPVRIGRSRSAEFSQVRIEVIAPPEYTATPFATAPERLVGYAHSDLCLLRQGVPVTFPLPSDLGLANEEWEPRPHLSELITRSYSPWNQFHRSRMMERQVISMGSVWVYTRRAGSPETEIPGILRLGEHQQEGLGEVWLNPSFLTTPPRVRLAQPSAAPPPSSPESMGTTPLLQYVRHRAENRVIISEAERLRKEWVRALKPLSRKIGSSQWSTVRTIAERAVTGDGKLQSDLETFCLAGRRKKTWKGVHTKILELREQCLHAKVPHSEEICNRALVFTARDLAASAANAKLDDTNAEGYEDLEESGA